MLNQVPIPFDPLTKIMDPVKLQTALDSNAWSLTQPVASLAKKRAKQLQRRKAVDTDAGTDNNGLAVNDPD